MADQKISSLTSLASADAADVLPIVDVSASTTKKITPAALKAGMALAKSDVGLSNVDNTSDVDKPVSTATQTALNAKEDVSNKSTSTALGTSNTLYPTQNAVKGYVDNAVSGRESTANKSDNPALPASSSLYPTTGAVKTYVDAGLATKANLLSRTSALVIETDFYSVSVPIAPGFQGSASFGGSSEAVAGEANHPGIIALRDSTTVDGGYRLQTNNNTLLLSGGEKFILTFQFRDTRTTSKVMAGFHDSQSIADPTDCACFIMVGTGTGVDITGRTRANNTATNTSTFSGSLNTWYTAIIEINSTATSAEFSILNDFGTVLFTGSLGNLPTTAGRELGVIVSAHESTTAPQQQIIWVDYLRFEINRTLVR